MVHTTRLVCLVTTVSGCCKNTLWKARGQELAQN